MSSSSPINGRIHQVDWIVVDSHPGDSTLDAHVKGLKIAKVHSSEASYPVGAVPPTARQSALIGY
jgi:hypothetical protein